MGNSDDAINIGLTIGNIQALDNDKPDDAFRRNTFTRMLDPAPRKPKGTLPELCKSPTTTPDAKVMKVPVLPNLIVPGTEGLALIELDATATYLLLVDPAKVTHKDRCIMVGELKEHGVRVVVVPVNDVNAAMVVYEAKPQSEYNDYLDESDPLVQHALREQDEGISDSLRDEFENEDDVGPCGEE